MRIVLTMVGIALGIAIAVVAGVYGWQEYELSRPAAGPAPVAQLPPTAPQVKPAANAPKPVDVPPASPPSATAPTPPSKPAAPRSPQPSFGPAPAAIANKLQPGQAAPTTPPGTVPPPGAPATQPPASTPAPGEEPTTPAPAEANWVTAEKLAQLTMGMSEQDIERTMGKEGVETPEDQLPAYTPEGWYEVRWPNPDGSYVAALFDDADALVHVEPFNLPGADAWMAAPAYAVPAWLNAQLRSNNMPVRAPAVAVVAAQANAYQFRGVLANADGQILGAIAGTYYVDDPAGQFSRAMEGNYEYTMPDGTVDADTFEFSE